MKNLGKGIILDKKYYQKLLKFYEDMSSVNGVCTGCTYSYQEMRELVNQLIELIPEEQVTLKSFYEEKQSLIDAIAFHYSIEQDACIGGYNGLF